jgi:hypothetical protein
MKPIDRGKNPTCYIYSTMLFPVGFEPSIVWTILLIKNALLEFLCPKHGLITQFYRPLHIPNFIGKLWF